MRLVNWRALVIGAAGFGLAACGDDVTVTPTPITFTTNPTSVACNTNQATAVGLSVSGGSGTPTITFTPSGSVITNGATSGSTFTFTCGSTAGAGAIGFTITSGGQTVSGSIPVTVTATNLGTAVTAISVNPSSATLVPGATTTITAQVTLASGAPATTSTAATFTTSDATIATVVTNANGTATVTALPNAANAGKQVVITATSVANTNLKAFTTINIASPSTIIASLNVSPTSVSLTTGGTQQITATATLGPNAPAGTSTGVTFTSSDTSIVKVTSTGAITAGSKAGTATITVASVAAPSVTQTIGVTVGAPAAVRLTIQGLQVVNAVGNLVPADPTNVAGNLFATLNLDPGSFTPDSVVATLGTQRVVCQRFSVQLAQALHASLTDGSADFAPIQCAINTSQFNPTTGAPAALNGLQQLSATVFYRPINGGASTSQTATINTPLTLNNQSGYFVAVTNAPSAAQVANGGPANGQATGPQGVLWRAGTINVSVLPVSFTGGPVGTGTQSLAVTLSDALSGQIASKTANFTPGTPFTVAFGGTTAPYTPIPTNTIAGCSQCLDGYTSPNAGQTGGGTTIQVGGNATSIILDANGVQVPGAVVFIDNASPEARAQFVSTNFLVAGGPTGFINGAFVFSDSVAMAAAATVLADNNGVDRVSRSFFFATNAAGLTAADIVAGGATVANGSQINQNVSPTAFAAAAKLSDALGNAVAVPVTALNGGPLFTFGVITAAPTLAVVSGTTTIAANQGIGIAQGPGARSINFSATSTSGAAFPTNFVVGTLQVLTPTGTFCATSADVAGSVLTGVSTTGTNPPCPTLAFNTVTIDPTTARAGIYTLSVQARDVAGNLSTAITRSFVIDEVAPVVVNPIVATPPLTGGQSETISATATDNLGLVSQLALVDFTTANAGGIPENIFRYDGTAIGTALAAPFTRSASLSATIPTFIRAVAAQGPTAGAFVNVSNQSFVTVGGIAIGASDNAANWGYGLIPAGTVQSLLDQTQTTPQFFATANGPQSLTLNFLPSTASSTTTNPFPLTLASATSGTPTSVTINLVQNGIANTPFVSPFAKVELYIRGTIPGNAQGVNPFPVSAFAYRLIGTFSGNSVSISTTSSTITNSITITPGSGGITAFPSSGTANLDLLVVATDANGFATTLAVPTIVLAP